MVTTATLAFLGLLSGVLFLAGASYISRTAYWRGSLVCALAGGLSMLSAFVIYPSLKHANGNGTISPRAELEQLKSDRDELLVIVDQKTRDSEALSKTNAFFSKLHKERLTRISEEVKGIMDVVLGPQSGMAIELDRFSTPVTALLDGPSGFDSIIADLSRLKALRVRTPGDNSSLTLAMLQSSRRPDSGTTGVILDAVSPDTAEAPGTAVAPAASATTLAMEQSDTLQGLRKAMDGKLSSNTYRIEPLGEPELVAGRRGTYYSVELTNAKSGERFIFDSGKYTFQSNRAAYKASFNSFAGDVLKVLDGKAKVDLFVRGSADAQPYTGALEPGFEFKKVSYLPSSRGKYLAGPAVMPVDSVVKNTDLPNLRGEYLRAFLSQLYPSAPATILEGQVRKKESAAARNTELILFVAWR